MLPKTALPRFRDLIGQTPMIDLSHLQGDAPRVQIIAKCEFLNPGMSLKDRIVSYIFDDAEAKGLLHKDSHILAASSGNTGASVAMLAAMRGYRATILTSPKCSKEKRDAIAAFGAEVLVIDQAFSGEDYMEAATRMAAEDPNIFDVDQYENPLNPEAHYRSLGREIWEQSGHEVTHFTCGASTGGSISGISRYLKEQNPDVHVTLADPEGSIFYDYFKTGELVKPRCFKVEGVGKNSIPGAMDFSLIDDALRISDEDSFAVCHRLAQEDGMLVGGSSGLNVFAALDLAKRVPEGSVIATLLVDSGVKYLSKIYNPDWHEA